jgi:hypothetical protein
MENALPTKQSKVRSLVIQSLRKLGMVEGFVDVLAMT